MDFLAIVGRYLFRGMANAVGAVLVQVNGLPTLIGNGLRSLPGIMLLQARRDLVPVSVVNAVVAHVVQYTSCQKRINFLTRDRQSQCR